MRRKLKWMSVALGKCEGWLRSSSVLMAGLLVAMMLSGQDGRAADYLSIQSGIWSDPFTWNQPGNPTGSDSATVRSGCTVTLDGGASGYIGSMAIQDTGSTLRLSTDLTVYGNARIGNGATLDMGGKDLQVANEFFLGDQSGAGILQNRGAINATYFNVHKSAFAMGVADSAWCLRAFDGALVTTASAGNVSAFVEVYGGGTLTLGANMTLTGTASILNGATLDMGGRNLHVANEFFLGNQSGAGILQNRGAINAGYFNVHKSACAMDVADSAWCLRAFDGASVTTASTGNVSAFVEVYGGGTLTLGANMALTGNASILNGATLDMGGKDLQVANEFFLGNQSGDRNPAKPWCDQRDVLQCPQIRLRNGRCGFRLVSASVQRSIGDYHEYRQRQRFRGSLRRRHVDSWCQYETNRQRVHFQWRDTGHGQQEPSDRNRWAAIGQWQRAGIHRECGRIAA